MRLNLTHYLITTDLTLLVAHIGSCVKGAGLDQFPLHSRNELGVFLLLEGVTVSYPHVNISGELLDGVSPRDASKCNQ